MAIATKTQIKTLLQINNTNYDNLIDELIPIVQDDLITYLKNYFKNTEIQYSNSTISFASNTISDSDLNFVDEGFVDGDYIIQGSKYNNTFVTVTNVVEGELTTSEDLITETAGNTIKLTFVQFPQGIIRIFANMIGWSISYKTGVKNETFSRYSISYGEDTQNRINGYPDSITNGLVKYKKCAGDY